MKIETKFNLGDKVYVLWHNQIVTGTISVIYAIVNEHLQNNVSESYCIKGESGVAIDVIEPLFPSIGKKFDLNEIFLSKRDLVEKLLS